MKLNDIIFYLEKKFPTKYALEWDNVGLQIGRRSKDLKSVYVCLSITEIEAREAISLGVDAIISHHPLIFEKLSSINTSQPYGNIIEQLIKQDIALYSMHTNYDVAEGGINDQLADQYDLAATSVIIPTYTVPLYKLAVYVPVKDFEKFRESFLSLNVGHIGKYSHCSFFVQGKGTFKPLSGSRPYIGVQDELTEVPEYRIETIVEEPDLQSALKEMQAVHPYEEVAFDVYPLVNQGKKIGLGRIGKLKEKKTLETILEIMPGTLKGASIDSGQKLSRIAVCSGSGGRLVKELSGLSPDLYITGDIGYHDDLDAKAYGIPILDIGHSQSENIGIMTLKSLIEEEFDNEITVYISKHLSL